MLGKLRLWGKHLCRSKTVVYLSIFLVIAVASACVGWLVARVLTFGFDVAAPILEAIGGVGSAVIAFFVVLGWRKQQALARTGEEALKEARVTMGTMNRAMGEALENFKSVEAAIQAGVSMLELQRNQMVHRELASIVDDIDKVAREALDFEFDLVTPLEDFPRNLESELERIVTMKNDLWKQSRGPKGQYEESKAKEATEELGRRVTEAIQRAAIRFVGQWGSRAGALSHWNKYDVHSVKALVAQARNIIMGRSIAYNVSKQLAGWAKRNVGRMNQLRSLIVNEPEGYETELWRVHCYGGPPDFIGEQKFDRDRLNALAKRVENAMNAIEDFRRPDIMN